MINKYLPGGLCGFDKDGSPIKIELFGYLDMKGIMYSTKKSDLEKSKLLQCEKTIDLWNEQSIRVSGRGIISTCVLGDEETNNTLNYSNHIHEWIKIEYCRFFIIC